MKKVMLSLLLLIVTAVTVSKVSFAEKEPTSGGLSPDQLELKDTNSKARGSQNVGGGTWIYYNNDKNQTLSSYYHRDKKHSATVRSTSGKYHKAVRPAGQWADAALPYVSGQNSVYWDNAPSEAVGDYRK